MKKVPDYNVTDQNLTPNQQNDLNNRIRTVAKVLPSLGAQGRSEIIAWLHHIDLCRTKETYREQTAQAFAAQKAPKNATTGARPTSERVHQPKKPHHGPSLLNSAIRNEWRTAHSRKTKPIDFDSALASLADKALCGTYGKSTARSDTGKWYGEDKRDQRQTSLSHKLTLLPTSDRLATPSTRQFAKIVTRIGLGYHIPLFPEGYYNQTVTMWHLIWHDQLTRLQWQCIEHICDQAAHHLELDYEFEPMGHCHIVENKRVNRADKYVPSQDMTTEEMHPKTMKILNPND